MRVWPGSPFPLGATWDGSGVNFALFSAHATAVDLCLFHAADATAERVRVPVTERTNGVWHVYLPDVAPGQLYGYRVSGPWDPARGERFNAHKVVLDPYARVLGRDAVWHPSLFAYQGTTGDGPLDVTDSAAYAALGMVTGVDTFDWADDRAPRVPWSDTVVYEAHVKGLTALNTHVPAPRRGTYLGLASDSVMEHLKQIGVTAVELLPIHAHSDEWRLVRAGLVNYWGYNTLSFFAPDARLSVSRTSQGAITEFKAMVRALHAAGLEVILDVVYNHSAESDHLGPTLSFRGIDNASYYRLDQTDLSHYENQSGCGNTLDIRTPRVLQLVMDSLRYWVTEMHVDGFRFDLASALARGTHGIDASASFFHTIAQDPLLSGVKLIAEPWDIYADGYQVGRFPAGWTEWNDKYREDVRRFWRGDAGMLPRLATRLAGSSDLFGGGLRGPDASLNFVTAHDGFTLADLVSYNAKHNDANGEDNRDGENNNYSWNCGSEGETNDASVLELRRRQRRNLLVTLLVSLGVPMISGGDEMGRTQAGNNNGYCHDSPLMWTPWDLDRHGDDFLTFVKAIAALRAGEPVLRRRTFFDGVGNGGMPDIVWLRPNGQEMSADDWADPERRAIGVLLPAEGLRQDDGRGALEEASTIQILFNAGLSPITFDVPPRLKQNSWQLAIDTARPGPARILPAGHPEVTLGPRSAAVLKMMGSTMRPRA